MRRTKKVITSAKFRTQDSSALINTGDALRSVCVGSRADESTSCTGFIGKVLEHASGKNILDYGVWLDLVFPHVIGVFGTRGTGKSFDLGVLAECVGSLPEVVSGRLPSTSVVIFDVQNQFWTLALLPNPSLSEDKHHIRTLEEWGLKPKCFQHVDLWLPAGCQSSLSGKSIFRLSPDQLEESDWLELLELERYSAIGQALLALLADSGSKEPVALASRAQQGRTLSRFQQGTIDALRWRLQALANTDLIGEPGININQFLVPGRVSTFLLRDLSESLRALAVGVLMRSFTTRMGAYHQGHAE